MRICFRIATAAAVARILGRDAAQRDALLEGPLVRCAPIGQMFLSQALIGRRAGLTVVDAALHQSRPLGPRKLCKVSR